MTLPSALGAPGRAEALEALCRRRGVAHLDLFGSAATDVFDPARSDIDFLVEFLPDPPEGALRAFLDLKRGLEVLFDGEVDLVDGPPARLRNPYFHRVVEATLRPILPDARA